LLYHADTLPPPTSPQLTTCCHTPQGAAYCTGRGEIVEDVAPPLPLDTKMLLVKPPVGLATPRIFKALDLGRRSTAEPRELLADMGKGAVSQTLVVNDLEQPAFDMWVVDRACAGCGPVQQMATGTLCQKAECTLPLHCHTRSSSCCHLPLCS
jgi:hypothetical protein